MATKQSPRITTAGVLTWYHGDAFDLDYVISLTRNGSPIVFAEGDSFQVSFYSVNNPEKVIYSFVCDEIGTMPGTETTITASESLYAAEDVVVNDNIVNYISLSFTPDISKQFDVGRYTYCIKYIEGESGYSTTIAAKRRAEVQRCH